MNKDFAKLVAVGLVAGVAKALFTDHPPVTHVHNRVEDTKTEEKV